MNILGIIPSRYGSTRFPGKPLIDINGKTMVQRVYEQVQKAECITKVIVATDDNKIFNHVESFNGNVLMTSSEHQSGTDRCAEVVNSLKENYDVVINIQGDEPFIDPHQINQLCNCFNNDNNEIATLVKKVSSTEELFDINKPKVIIDNRNFAIYFSRTPIPFLRDTPKDDWLKKHIYFKHLGIYGYRTETLKKITLLPPSSLELAEKLEQLRWLENGFKINVAETTLETLSIDTPEDLKKIIF